MEFPNPLTPADCDLRDFQYMPLDVQRLCDSDLAALESPEACWAALLLWCKAWHQVPAGSLPSDDRVLAKFTGYQRAPESWHAIREGALRGWIECADGRLYHPVVAEKANEAWFAKHRQAHDKLCERVRKKNKSRVESGLLPLEVPELEQWIDMGRPLEKQLFPSEYRSASAGTPKPVPGKPDDFRRNDGDFPPENALKGKGREGIGKGEGEVKSVPANDGIARASREGSNESMTPAGISVALIGWERERNKAARGISASTPQVIDLAELKVTRDELRRAYDAAIADRQATGDLTAINAGFVRMFVEKHRNPPKQRQQEDAWRRSDQGIERKASELGIYARPGETHDALRERCDSELRRRAQGVAA